MAKINLKKRAIKAIGYNPFKLPKNEFNQRHNFFLKVRALFKLMLYAHIQINFPRFWDADFGQYRKRKGQDYLPLARKVDKILKYRTGNCGTYSKLFEMLAQSIGFKVRHVGLLSENKKSGHWCSEVMVDNQWIFFDTMYLNCPMSFTSQGIKFHTAYEIKNKPSLYIQNIPDILKGISDETWLSLWQGLEIDKINSYNMSDRDFKEKFYGERK